MVIRGDQEVAQNMENKWKKAIPERPPSTFVGNQKSHENHQEQSQKKSFKMITT